MNPYKILGLDKSATPMEIRKAYKQLASKHHPDKPGGDKERFQEVKAAYEILIDEKSRAHFDKTGTVEGILDPRDHAIQGMMQLISSLIDDGSAFETENIFRVAEKLVANKRQSDKADSKRMEKYLNKLNKLLKRVIRRDGGENLVSRLIDERILNVERTIAAKLMDVEVGKIMLDMLKNYDYDDIDQLTGPMFNLGDESFRFLG